MEIFTNDQPDAFLSWADDHWRDGYVLTQRGRHRMIHTYPRCSHLCAPWKNYPSYRIIDKPRRCSTELAELESLARDETGDMPVHCEDCEREKAKFAAS